MGLYAIKTKRGKEYDVAITLKKAIEKGDYDVYSLIVIPEIKGLVFVEASSLDEVYFLIRGISYVKGVVRGEIKYEEIERFIIKKEEEIEFSKGDIVEIIAGPFKGEKGKIIRIDKNKKEVVLELLGAVVSIPITISIDDIKLVEKAKKI